MFREGGGSHNNNVGADNVVPAGGEVRGTNKRDKRNVYADDDERMGTPHKGERGDGASYFAREDTVIKLDMKKQRGKFRRKRQKKGPGGSSAATTTTTADASQSITSSSFVVTPFDSEASESSMSDDDESDTEEEEEGEKEGDANQREKDNDGAPSVGEEEESIAADRERWEQGDFHALYDVCKTMRPAVVWSDVKHSMFYAWKDQREEDPSAAGKGVGVPYGYKRPPLPSIEEDEGEKGCSTSTTSGGGGSGGGGGRMAGSTNVDPSLRQSFYTKLRTAYSSASMHVHSCYALLSQYLMDPQSHRQPTDKSSSSSSSMLNPADDDLAVVRDAMRELESISSGDDDTSTDSESDDEDEDEDENEDEDEDARAAAKMVRGLRHDPRLKVEQSFESGASDGNNGMNKDDRSVVKDKDDEEDEEAKSSTTKTTQKSRKRSASFSSSVSPPQRRGGRRQKEKKKHKDKQQHDKERDEEEMTTTTAEAPSAAAAPPPPPPPAPQPQAPIGRQAIGDPDGPTHVALNKGRFHIPIIHPNDSTKAVQMKQRHERSFYRSIGHILADGASPLFLVEQKTPVFRFMMDLDVKQGAPLNMQQVEGMTVVVQMVVTQFFQGPRVSDTRFDELVHTNVHASHPGFRIPGNSATTATWANSDGAWEPASQVDATPSMSQMPMSQATQSSRSRGEKKQQHRRRMGGQKQPFLRASDLRDRFACIVCTADWKHDTMDCTVTETFCDVCDSVIRPDITEEGEGEDEVCDGRVREPLACDDGGGGEGGDLSQCNKCKDHHVPRTRTTVRKCAVVKSGVHLVWPCLFVTKEQALFIREMVIHAMRGVFGPRSVANLQNDWDDVVDNTVYCGSGLRMVGNCKAAMCSACKGTGDRNCGRKKETVPQRRDPCSECVGIGRLNKGRPYVPSMVVGRSGRRDVQLESLFLSGRKGMEYLVFLTKMRTNFAEADVLGRDLNSGEEFTSGEQWATAMVSQKTVWMEKMLQKINDQPESRSAETAEQKPAWDDDNGGGGDDDDDDVRMNHRAPPLRKLPPPLPVCAAASSSSTASAESSGSKTAAFSAVHGVFRHYNAREKEKEMAFPTLCGFRVPLGAPFPFEAIQSNWGKWGWPATASLMRASVTHSESLYKTLRAEVDANFVALERSDCCREQDGGEKGGKQEEEEEEEELVNDFRTVRDAYTSHLKHMIDTFAARGWAEYQNAQRDAHAQRGGDGYGQ